MRYFLLALLLRALRLFFPFLSKLSIALLAPLTLLLPPVNPLSSIDRWWSRAVSPPPKSHPASS
jgi:hypothetical protein